MVTTTPNARNHQQLATLASRYVEVDQLPWVATRWPGIELKVLMEDKQAGLLTALTRFAPGAILPDHEHTEIEQTYVIEGSLIDAEGEAKVGQYVWRPAGSRHDAHSPGGCVVLSFFLKPNKFFDMP
jgi:anti-sigma factor ChrR (cupin superfamily)